MEEEISLYDKYVQGRVYLVLVVVLAFSLVFLFLTAKYEGVFWDAGRSVASGLIPACLVGLLWDFILKREYLSYVRSNIADEIADSHRQELTVIRQKHDELESRILENCTLSLLLDAYGIRQVSQDRAHANLDQRIATAQQRVWILLTSFSYITETSNLLKTIVRKAQAGIQVRLLGLAPDTPAAQLRSSFAPDYRTLNDLIHIYNKRVLEASCCLKQNGVTADFDIRLYDKIPTCALFIVDSTLVACTLLCGTRGRDSVHLVVSEIGQLGTKSELFCEFENHFKTLWEQATPLIGPGD